MPGMCWRLWNEFVSRGRPSLQLLVCVTVSPQDVPGKVILDFGVVPQVLIVSRLEELFTPFAELLANSLLHTRIAQFSLTGRFFGDESHDSKAEDLFGGGINHRNDWTVLARLELHYRVPSKRICVAQ